MSTTPPPDLGEKREELMARVRAALGRKAGDPLAEPPPQVDESLARLASHDDDLPGLFAQKAESVGMRVHRVHADHVGQKVSDVLLHLHAKRIGLAVQHTFPHLAEILRHRFEVVDWHATDSLEPQYDLDAGITDVHAALAETGTLVCSSGSAPGSSRGMSLVPPAHVALVRAHDILPDMLDFYARLRGLPAAELPSNIAFITGPSKTADIEGELITGVHGPGEVHIILIEG